MAGLLAVRLFGEPVPGFPVGDPALVVGPHDVERVAAEEAAQRRLLGVDRIEDGWEDKVFSRAGVDRWQDMEADRVAKCVDYLKGLTTSTPAEPEGE